MISETIYKNRDNVISLELRSDGVAQNISSSTKITIEFGGVTFSSATATTGAIDYTTYGSTGMLDHKTRERIWIKNYEDRPA